MGSTPNLNLYKPDVGSMDWGGDVNDNWDTLDGAIVRDGAGVLAIVQDTVGDVVRSGLGAEGQVTLSAALDQDDWLLKRNVDGGSSYAEAGAVLVLQRNVTDVTSEDGNFLECVNAGGTLLAGVGAEGYLSMALVDVQGNTYSVRIGYQAAGSATAASVVAIGYQAGRYLSTGTGNVFVGTEVAEDVTTETDNTVIGSRTAPVDIGDENVVLGFRAALKCTGIDECVIAGYYACYEGGGDRNVAIGERVGQNFDTAEDNVLIGTAAGRYSVAGARNVGIGVNAAYDAESTDNVCLGRTAGRSLTSATGSVLAGYGAGYSLTTGSGNVFCGEDAGDDETTGQRNVAFGLGAGQFGLGTENVLLGMYAGRKLSGTTGNVFAGYDAGYNNVTGNYNVLLGHYAGEDETGSNKLYVSYSDTASPLVYGEFDNTLLRINGHLVVAETDASDVGFMVQGAASQSADLQRWTDSNSNVLGRVDASGYIGFGNLADTGRAGGGLELGGVERTTDTAPGTLTLQGNTAKSDASVNQDGGDLRLTPGDHASGGGNEGTTRIANADGSTAVAEFTDSTLGVFGTTPASQGSYIADPSGGTTVDSEARAATNAILDAIETFGLMASS